MQGKTPSSPPFAWPVATWQQAASYTLDAWQRSILFMDILRQRGNQYFAHMEQAAPNVLQFSGDVLLDGRNLARPVNYGLVRITPPDGVAVNPRKRPFIVFDPRAGHGPGIGGFKADSELGVAMRAGHPAYFVGFLPRPQPGQTVEDVVMAEIQFVEHVGRLHPDADGKPVVIGNCQAGWQVMMAAALRPDLFGPIILAGAPLSYWAGHEGGSTMRYSGGLLGGSWLTALTGDIGGGLFDGAWLVQNFENMNPANTLWKKQYNVYANVDTEAPRYLEFERWWGGHVLLNADEMQYIVDNLFIGNRLATADIVTSDGRRIDFRNIRSPIIVFCSKGDDITPPAQALGWITDLYGSLDDIRAHDQTIVYAVHETIGHLGIFVSTKVARTEHEQFATNIDLIDILPPGLYEAELHDAAPGHDDNNGVISRFAARTLDDIRVIVGHDDAEERRFATVDRLSKINLGLYRSLAQPFVRASVSDASAEWTRLMHPLRLGFALFSDHNPWMASLADAADAVRQQRQPVEQGNPYAALERIGSDAITHTLDGAKATANQWSEQAFHAIYGSPILQTLLGITGEDGAARRHPGQDWDHQQETRQRIAELHARLGEGGLDSAAVRALLYVGVAEGAADERAFLALRGMHHQHDTPNALQDFKHDLREQYCMLLISPEAALTALPFMLADSPADQIQDKLQRLERILTAGGPLAGEALTRWQHVQELFLDAARHAAKRASPGVSASAASPAAPAIESKAASPSTQRAAAPKRVRKAAQPATEATAKPAAAARARPGGAKAASPRTAPAKTAPAKSVAAKLTPVKSAPDKAAPAKAARRPAKAAARPARKSTGTAT